MPVTGSSRSLRRAAAGTTLSGGPETGVAGTSVTCLSARPARGSLLPQPQQPSDIALAAGPARCRA
jgi:hypothetical protein